MLYTTSTSSAVHRSALKQEPVDTRLIASGFPAASDDYGDHPLNLHELLVHNQPATYFMKAANNDYAGEGIHRGDLMIIDRSVHAAPGRLVIAVIDGELCVRRIVRHGEQLCFAPPPGRSGMLYATDTKESWIWGVVTYVVHNMVKEYPNKSAA